MGEGVSKIRKNCRRRLWMVPKVASINSLKILNCATNRDSLLLATLQYMKLGKG